MKSSIAKTLVPKFIAVFVIACLFVITSAEARYYGGFSGGSFRGEAVRTPYGGAVAVRGPAGNVVVGERVAVLPVEATPIDINATTYYLYDGVYYEENFDGGEVTYVVVPDPQQ
jgi:hypothetical protein